MAGVAAVQAQGVSPRPQHALRTTHAVHSLASEEAAGALPVHLHAVVTYYDPYIDARHGALFVHDATGDLFVSIPARPILPLEAGDVVEVTGVTSAGDYAPIVAGSEVRAAGHSRLPATAHHVTMAQMLSGATDAEWVEVDGRVRSAHLEPKNVVLEISTEGGMLIAVSIRQEGVDYGALVDSLLRIRGNSAPVFNRRRQMVGVHVFFPTLREVTVLQAGPRDPFAVPAVALSQLFRFSPEPGLVHRVHVAGRVTLDWPGRMLCIEDGDDGICAQTTQATPVAVGSLVDVLGFPAIRVFKPTLEDATFRAVSASDSREAAIPISAEQAVRGDLDGRLVQIDGELIGRDLAAVEPTLMLRAGRLLIPVILPKDSIPGNALTWKDGTTLRITGVCDVLVDPLNTNLNEGAVRPQSARILLRSMTDIKVVRAPTWWNTEHTLETLAGALLLMLAAFAWIVVLRHRVAQQTRALRGSEERLRHLSEHDVLTGLPNRLLLNDRLQVCLKRAQRFDTCLGLLMVDVDEFKEVNDALGHRAGDKLLCELAGRLTGCIRATDTVARIGGDEFIVLLPDLHAAAEAETIAAKIVAAAARPVAIDHRDAVIKVSVGVVTYPDGCTELESLMPCADEAMYAAKQKGKNGYQVYRPKSAGAGGRGLSVLKPAAQAPNPRIGM